MKLWDSCFRARSVDEASSDSPAGACEIVFAEGLARSPEIACGAESDGAILNIAAAPADVNAMDRACGARASNVPVDQDWLARRLHAQLRGGK